MTHNFIFVIIISLSLILKSIAYEDEKSANNIDSLESQEFVNNSSPVISLDLEGANVNFYNSWSPWTFGINNNNRRDDAHIYSNDNTKHILQGLAAFGASGSITQNRSMSIFNGMTYYHGQRFYPRNASKDVVSCSYKPQFLYFANYEDKQPVDAIYFDCTTKQYCSELECFNTALWWIAICVVVPFIILLVIGIVICRIKFRI